MGSCARLSYPVHIRVLSVCAPDCFQCSPINTVSLGLLLTLALWPVTSSPKNLPYIVYLFGCIRTTCSNLTTFCWTKKYPLFSSSLYFPIASVTHIKKNLGAIEEKKCSLTLKSLGIVSFPPLKSKVSYLFRKRSFVLHCLRQLKR